MASYPIRIWSGLVSPTHREQMGTSVWEFLWLVDKVTKEEDGRGYVLGGKPINLVDIAADMGVSEKSITRSLQRLRDHGYIEVKRKPGGLVIVVLKSKKRTTKPFLSIQRPDRSVRSEETDSSCGVDTSVRTDKNICSPIKDISVSSPRSHDMYKDSNSLYGIKAGSDLLFEEIRALPEDVQQKLAAEALKEMAEKPFTRTCIVETPDGYVLGRSPAARVMLQMHMRMIYEWKKAA